MSYREGESFSEPYVSVLPLWTIWFSTVVLSFAFVIGLPLNGATVLIFWRRKKLRHLVNFVLLLDCLSHIVLCLVCIPIHLVTVWGSASLASSGFSGLAALQQVVGNFANLYSTFLTVSIAILRYRRLCWKKKDKFSTMNAIKWSVLSGTVALGLTFTQSYSKLFPDSTRVTMTVYLVKITLIIFSMVIVFFCYIRLSQRVWANAANHEKVMDPMKLKKSRSVHMKATIHSCVQIILVVATVSPHFYEQTVQAFHSSTINPTSVDVDMDVEEHESSIIGEEDSSAASSSASVSSTNSGSTGDNHFARLIGITLNYTLLALGTPIAYIASCHRFREQFTSILFGQVGHLYSPHNSTSPHQQNNNQNHHSNHNHNGHTNRRYSNPSSRIGGKTYSTTTTNPMISTTTTTAPTTANCTPTKSALSRSVVSSIRSKNGGSKRRKSRQYGTGEMDDSDSTAILHDGEHNSFRYSPSPTNQLMDIQSYRKHSYCSQTRTPVPTVTAIRMTKSNSSNIHTILQNYGYGYNDVGQTV